MFHASEADEFDDDDELQLDNQFLTFQVRGEEYALALAQVREIVEYVEPTPVPLMPACLTGVVNLRGKVLPSLDLGHRLGKPPLCPTKRTSIVVAELEVGGASISMGVVVDVVQDVVEISEETIESAPNFGTHIRAEFIAGMAQRESGFLVILDAQCVLSVEELGAIDALTAEGVQVAHGGPVPVEVDASIPGA